MGKIHRESIASCYECAALAYCYQTKQPTLGREEMRQRAAACDSFRKGITTETVAVVGREKGMSRKKAERLVNEGKATWAAKKTVQLAPETAP